MTKKIESFSRQLGKETIQLMADLHGYAKKRIHELQARDSFFSYGSGFTGTGNLTETIRQSREVEGRRLEGMSKRPLLAHFTLMKADGTQKSYYVGVAAPLSKEISVPGVVIASYRSPVGRLAEYEVGDDVRINGIRYEMLDRQIINNCVSYDGQWDGINVYAYEFDDVTHIPSIQKYLKEYEEEEAIEPVDLFAASEKQEPLYYVEEQFGLRWQSILDKTQGEIFRKPLNSRIILLGPPGTGKTTTLVKRLYQKLDYEDNSSEEINGYRYQEVPPRKDWLVFTPTELLRLSLKNAINKENVAADDNSVRTWDEYRRQVSRDDLQLLKTNSHDGFLLISSETSLKESCFNDNLEWAEDFSRWQKNKFLNNLLEVLKDTKQLGGTVDAGLLALVSGMARENSSYALGEVFKSVEDIQSSTRVEQQDYKDRLKKVINGTFNLLNNRSKGEFLGDWKEIVRSCSLASPESEGEEVDVLEQETKLISESSVISTLSKLIQAKFVSDMTKRSMSKKNTALFSLLEKLPYWSDSTLVSEEAQYVAGKILLMRRYRYLAHILQRYLRGFFRSYSEFRKTEQSQNRWYFAERVLDKKICRHECDMLLAVYFGNCDELLMSTRQYVDSDVGGFWSPLKRFTNLQKMQILIDEVADFSPNQLRCMYFLARENARSIFACGDLNQRMTTFGVKDRETLELVLHDADVYEIRTSYRQSSNLHKFTQAIIHDTDESRLSKISEKNIGLKPILAEETEVLERSIEKISRWIRRIDDIVGTSISIAVFVPSEEYVGEVANMLKENLQDISLDVIACRDGNSVGKGGAVRVFDIQHIKGLEFEAAFFFDLDCMKEFKNLFIKILYVGATRARSFLGITCRGKLPEELSYLREDFVETWD